MTGSFSTRLESIPPSGIRRFFDLVIGAEDIISLGVGEPDFNTPWSIREAAISAIEQGRTTYTSNAGLSELRHAIVGYLTHRFGVSYHPDNECMITNGVSEGADITFRALLNPGDEVILPEPSYVCYAPLVELCGGVIKTVNTSNTGFIPTSESIEACITEKTKAIILCSPNNPTGAVIPKHRLVEIADLAEKYDLWVISDEIYAELTYDSKYTSMAAIKGMQKRCILLNGFSKAFAMTGWRLAYICAPNDVIRRTMKIHQYSALCSPILSQLAGVEALRHALDDVNDMRESFKKRRNFFVKQLNDIGLETSMPGGAFYCFVSITSTGLTSEEFAIKLLEQGKVAVVPGNVFGKGGEGFVRCCYATDINELKEALARIKAFINN